MSDINALARQLFATAINEDRCGELLMCLFEGGSATVDHKTGQLVLATAEQLEQLSVVEIVDDGRVAAVVYSPEDGAT